MVFKYDVEMTYYLYRKIIVSVLSETNLNGINKVILDVIAQLNNGDYI
jgi:hypothetical protein